MSEKDPVFEPSEKNPDGHLFGGRDPLSESGILEHFRYRDDLRIELRQTVTSTNTLLRERVREPEGLILAANEQTAGSGRLGRKFHSPQGTGIYFSVLLKPESAHAKTTLITPMAAVAVCRAIREVTGKNAQIKWVNDIYLNKKKVCGILTLASFSRENGQPDYVILGIGINVYRPGEGFPEDLENIAGAIEDKPQRDLKNRLLASVMNHFWDLYQHFDRQAIADEYRSSSFVMGKDVWVVTPTEKVAATVLDIDGNCNLVVQYDDGRVVTLSSNEISIRIQPENP